MRPGPTTWFVGPEGVAAGLDRDLADLFAKELGLPLRVISVENPWQLIAETSNGEAHIGAGGLYRPANSSVTGPAPLLFTRGYYAIEPVLVYNTDGFKPESWNDLTGEIVGIVEGTGLEATLAKVRSDHPDVQWRPLALPAAEGTALPVDGGWTAH